MRNQSFQTDSLTHSKYPVLSSVGMSPHRHPLLKSQSSGRNLADKNSGGNHRNDKEEILMIIHNELF